MRHPLIALSLVAAGMSVFGQEMIPHDLALQYASVLTNYTKEMRAAPLLTHPDFSKPVGVRDEGYGGLVLPEKGLTADMLSKAGKDAVPVGQLWLVKLSPVAGEKVVPVAKLQIVHIVHGDTELDAACCALGVRKAEAGLELLIYGKATEPVLRVPLKAISATQQNPIELTAERTGDSGLIKLSFAGKYQASFSVSDPEQN